MTKEISEYIKLIKIRIEGSVPKEELSLIMEDVSNVIIKNWVDGLDYKLNVGQIMSLVRRHIAKKYTKN